MYRKLFLVRLACLLSLFGVTDIVHAQVCVDLVGDGAKPIQAVNAESLHVANDYDTIVHADTRVGVVYLSLIGGSQPRPNACGLTPKNPSAEWTGWGGPLDTDNATVGEGPWSRNHIVIGGIYFERGLGSHAVGTLVYDLSGETYTRFEGWIGMSDEKDPGECGHGGSGTFVFLLDGREVFHSSTLLGAEGGRNVPPVKVAFAIPATARELTIVMGDGGDGIACDHSVIGDAKLLTARVTGVGSEPVRVSTVEPVVDPPIQEPVQPPVVETPVQRPPVVEIPVQQQADRPIVRLIYFRPSDRPIQPHINTLMDSVIKDVQRFYAAQMEQHGYGRKTFRFEVDASGTAVVHHVNGQFNDAYYQDALLSKVAEEIRAQVPTERDIYLVALDSSQKQYCGVASGGMAFMRAPGVCARPWVAAHELGHTFGLLHDARDPGHVMNSLQPGEFDKTSLSDCTAEWLDVHPAFNAGHSAVNNEPATIEMLAPSLTSPNTVRLRFEVTDLNGLHQAQLFIGKGRNTEATLTTCKQFNGNPSGSLEFVTTGFPPEGSAALHVIDMQGNTNWQYFPIDITPLLPPAQVVTIPDANLAVAIREALELAPGIPITTHAMLNLVELDAYNREIKDITGLEHAHNLRFLDIGAWEVNGEWVNSNVITDLSPLSGLTNLVRLSLGKNYIWNLDFLRELPPLAPVSIPDLNLAAAIRQELVLTPNEPVTTISILGLVKLEARNRGIKDLTGLEHAVNLTEVVLGSEYIHGEGYVNSNAISDLSPIEKLTNLEELNLTGMSGLRDVSALARLTNLERLDLAATAVSDVSALARLTNLEWLRLINTGVSDVSVLTYLTQLEELNLGRTAVSDVSALARLTNLEWLELWGTAVSDVSALAHLTNLETLALSSTAVSDVSALASLTNLERLWLNDTDVSDVSALAHLTNLKKLGLNDTDVSDVSPLLGLSLPGVSLDSIGLRLKGCPLSYASIHTHIPALQAKGIEVEFDNVAHPALLKVSGDRQEGAGATALPNPFVVEAMDEHGEPIVGRTVEFDILGGGGRLSAKTVETDARGKARVTLTLGSSQGVNKVRASSEGIRSWVLFTAVGTKEAPQLVADVNGDGVTDLADLAIVAQAMGKPVENPRADVNGDGVVDGEDFALVAAHLGEGEAAAPSQAAFPAGLTLEKVEWALNFLYAENTGSPAFRRGIAKLEGFLALLVPDKTLLLANYPNPFNPETWIPYQLSKPAEVTVTIYAANGAVVRTLALGHRRAGSYESRSRAAYWDGRNAAGEPVASGVYFYTLSAGDFSATRKMVIRK